MPVIVNTAIWCNSVQLASSVRWNDHECWSGTLQRNLKKVCTTGAIQSRQEQQAAMSRDMGNKAEQETLVTLTTVVLGGDWW